MKTKFLKALQSLQKTFEYLKDKPGTSPRTIEQNEIIENSLLDYFTYAEAEIQRLSEKETEMFCTHSAILEKFERRGYFILLHGYSPAAMEWIDRANSDFLESELSLRTESGQPIEVGFLNFTLLQTNYRAIVKIAEADIAAIAWFRYMQSQSEVMPKYIQGMKEYKTQRPHLVKYFENQATPKLFQLIKYHCFNSGRYARN